MTACEPLWAALLSGNTRGVNMNSFADRAWYAYHCLPRTKDGDAPKATALEKTVRPPLPHGILSKVFRGKHKEEGRKIEHDTMRRLAIVLNTTTEWLLYGRGTTPQLSGKLPPRPGTLGSQDDVQDELAAALTFVRSDASRTFPEAFLEECERKLSGTEHGLTRLEIVKMIDQEFGPWKRRPSGTDVRPVQPSEVPKRSPKRPKAR